MTQAAGSARRARRDPWKAAFFGIAAVSLAGGVAWALLGSSFLVVRSVRTIGPGHIPRAQILAAAGIRIGTPLIRIDTGAVARRVEQITQVQVARVTRSWPDAIVIWTMRRRARFAVQDGRVYALVDPYGVILGSAASPPAGLVRLSVPGRLATALRGSGAVRAAASVIAGLPGWLADRVWSIRAAGPAAVTLVLRGGVTVLWGTADRTAAKAREMRILLRTGARYYDVSDPITAVTGAFAGQGG